jgi:hypothetical protein
MVLVGSHRVHVGFDPNTGAFVGLPPEWEKLLTSSAITKEGVDSSIVLRVLLAHLDIRVEFKNLNDSLGVVLVAGINSPSNGQPKAYGSSVGSSIAPPRPPPPGPMLLLAHLDIRVEFKNLNDSLGVVLVVFLRDSGGCLLCWNQLPIQRSTQGIR